jgi:hypothetical protein
VLFRSNIVPTRKKIGYISYDKDLVEELPAKIEEKEIEVPMSKAQASLLDSIGSLAEVITGDNFSKYPSVQRDAFVMQLINFVSLNAELNVKTLMAIEAKGG